ncbi:MAG: ABC transporter ATP-binding protein, partial [Nevskiales bacterium]
LVIRPDVLLLDEPLSNLDAALRKQMQIELKRIHEELCVTTVLVTHSQEEALVMSDRIAVLRDGRIDQIGEPQTLYNRPATRFVCTFLGDANLLDCIVDAIEPDGAVVRAGSLVLKIDAPGNLRRGQRLTLAIRPEYVQVTEPAPDAAIAGAIVTDVIFKGNQTCYYAEAAGRGFMALALPSAAKRMFHRGEAVALDFARANVVVLDATEQSVA